MAGASTWAFIDAATGPMGSRASLEVLAPDSAVRHLRLERDLVPVFRSGRD